MIGLLILIYLEIEFGCPWWLWTTWGILFGIRVIEVMCKVIDDE